MRKKLLWITETAVMLALLVSLQWITKPMGQLVTGSVVNAVLAVTVLASGLPSGITVAFISPVLAYLLNIAPQILTVPAIMVGNTVYVLLLYFLAGKDSRKILRHLAAWIAAAAAKFAGRKPVPCKFFQGVDFVYTLKARRIVQARFFLDFFPTFAIMTITE